MQKIFEVTAELIEKYCGLNYEQVFNNLEIPPQNNGDIALPCFKLAKELKKSPIAIAQELQAKLIDDKIKLVENVNGYLNIFYKAEFLSKLLLNDIKNINFKEFGANKTILIEHTSINPNASPHVGRARNALIGDSITRLFKFLGFRTDVHYFVNDVGKQIALLVYATENLENYSFDDILQIYIDANEDLKLHPEKEKIVFDLLEKFENGDADTVKAFNKIVDVCLTGQRSIFEELDIHYDHFDYESQFIHNKSTDALLEKIKTLPSVFEDNDGRIVINQKGKNIGIDEPYLVLTRANKTSLYCLRDLCYSIYKAKQNTYRNIILLGEDQKVYYQQIASVLEDLGEKPAECVNYSFVLLPEGKMSTRNGTVVLLTDFMKECFNKTNEKLCEKNGETNDAKAKIMGYGALKYAILKCSPDKNVVFDWQNALNFNGDSSLYIQYNYARIKSILRKSVIEFNNENCNFELLISNDEKQLIKQLSLFYSTLLSAYKYLNPSIICNYAYKLTSLFSQFYTNQSILNIEDVELKKARLYLCQLTSTYIKNCLYIIGIDTVEEM